MSVERAAHTHTWRCQENGRVFLYIGKHYNGNCPRSFLDYLVKRPASTPHSLPVVAPLILVIKVPDEPIQRLDKRLQAGTVRPDKPMTVHLPLRVTGELARVSRFGGVQHTANVGVVLHCVGVVVRPAAHVGIVLTRVFFEADHGSGGGGREEKSAESHQREKYCDGLHHVL